MVYYIIILCTVLVIAYHLTYQLFEVNIHNYDSSYFEHAVKVTLSSLVCIYTVANMYVPNIEFL